MKKHFAIIAMILTGAFSASAAAPRPAPRKQQSAPTMPDFANDKDQTLHAMQDEMNRSKARLVIPSVGKPYFIAYRLLDLDVREISASFGALVSTSVSRTRTMAVDVRVGNYHLDSSNYIGEGGFQGVFGNTGQVGIDRDYHSLRQDLWLATDEAYKAAAAQLSLKQAFLSSLTKPPEIDDFSQAPPLVDVEPRLDPDWTSRNWEDEARTASAGLTKFPQLYGSHVNYYLIYATTYLMTSEGTVVRNSRSFAAIEAALDTQADDGMPLHNFYAVDVLRPADLPDAETVAKNINDAATQLMALREAPLVSDYTGPVLFDPSAAGSLIAQLSTPSLSGARPPLSSNTQFDAMMERFGGQSEWSGRVGTRVLPNGVSLVDDPAAAGANGQPLIGDYKIDDEGVDAQKVNLVTNGMLTGLLMTRRPGPDFDASNGHARAGDTQPLPSNLIFQATDTLDAAALQKKFMDACKDDGHNWCIEVTRMDNPALGAVSAGDAADTVSELAGGLSSGTRLPLMMYKVYVADGHKELVRGATLQDLTARSLRNILGIGSDSTVFNYLQNDEDGLAGTALGAFGSAAEGGIPSTVTTPSLLLDEVDVEGFHGEPRRLPLVPPPPMQ
ncbi:MAG TPA: metallopeptidase TldD-related protein [Candidatus Aquilonibacter sp.]|nr:metallopeptidase TldD-related protein [Candidatus Aquilonibacter sp.]